MVIAAVVGGVLSIKYWITPTFLQLLLLLSLGVYGYFGQVYMTKAFQIASTNQVAPLKYHILHFDILNCLATVMRSLMHGPLRRTKEVRGGTLKPVI